MLLPTRIHCRCLSDGRSARNSSSIATSADDDIMSTIPRNIIPQIAVIRYFVDGERGPRWRTESTVGTATPNRTPVSAETPAEPDASVVTAVLESLAVQGLQTNGVWEMVHPGVWSIPTISRTTDTVAHAVIVTLVGTRATVQSLSRSTYERAIVNQERMTFTQDMPDVLIDQVHGILAESAVRLDGDFVQCGPTTWMALLHRAV